jgi:hypothetical protein
MKMPKNYCKMIWIAIVAGWLEGLGEKSPPLLNEYARGDSVTIQRSLGARISFQRA